MYPVKNCSIVRSQKQYKIRIENTKIKNSNKKKKIISEKIISENYYYELKLN